MKTSLVISTYNWPEALELVLLSVKRQKVLPDEVIIADDGSGEVTKNLIATFQASFPVPLIHVWIPDEGFRKTMILNLAFSKVNNPYIIQIDGDCILHPYFIKDHKKIAKRNAYVQGSRIYMSEEKSEQILKTKNTNIKWWSGNMINAESGIRNYFLRRFMSIVEAKSTKVKGANMSFWTEDLIEINGYNEAMTGWGSEDWELAQRLRNIGRKALRLKFGGVMFHIYHKEFSRARSEINEGIAEATKNQRLVRCEKGLDQYLSQ